MKGTKEKVIALLAGGLICAGGGFVGFAADDIPQTDWPDENNYYQELLPGSYLADSSDAGGAGSAPEDEEYQAIIDSAGESTRHVSNSPALGHQRVSVSSQLPSFGVEMNRPLQIEGEGDGAVTASAALKNIAKAIAGNDAILPAEEGSPAESGSVADPALLPGTATDHPNTGAGNALLSAIACGLAAAGLGLAKKERKARGGCL